jgi:hypothetical protein
MGVKQNKIEKHQPRSSAGAQTGDAHEDLKLEKMRNGYDARLFALQR